MEGIDPGGLQVNRWGVVSWGGHLPFVWGWGGPGAVLRRGVQHRPWPVVARAYKGKGNGNVIT